MMEIKFGTPTMGRWAKHQALLACLSRRQAGWAREAGAALQVLSLAAAMQRRSCTAARQEHRSVPAPAGLVRARRCAAIGDGLRLRLRHPAQIGTHAGNAVALVQAAEVQGRTSTEC